MNCEEALKHPYLSAYHDEKDEVKHILKQPSHKEAFDFEFDSINDMDTLKGFFIIKKK